MKFLTTQIHIRPTERFDFRDITNDVKSFVSGCGVTTGFVIVFTHHTTSCIRINEHEKHLMDDFKYFLENVAPSTKTYRHDDISKRDCPDDEPLNGHAHCKSLLLNSSETVPIVNGQLQLGKWQSIFHLDLDGNNRERTVTVMVAGE